MLDRIAGKYMLPQSNAALQFKTSKMYIKKLDNNALEQ